MGYAFSPPYFLRSRNLLIRTYFEIYLQNKSEYQLLDNALRTLENSLYKNKAFSEIRIEPLLNLIQILRGLSTRVQKGTRKSSIKNWSFKQLENRKNTVSKNWLLEKIKIL